MYGVLAKGEEWTTCDKLLSFLADARDMRTGTADGQIHDQASLLFFLVKPAYERCRPGGGG